MNYLEIRFFCLMGGKDADHPDSAQGLFVLSDCFAEKPLDSITNDSRTMFSTNKDPEQKAVTREPKQSEQRCRYSLPRFEQCPDIALA